VTAAQDIRRRIRESGGRGRKVRGLLEMLRPYRGRAILAVLAMAAATAASLAPAPLAKTAIDSGIIAKDRGTLDLVVVAFVASALVYWGASYAQTFLVNWAGERALRDLRMRIFGHLQSMPVGFFETRQTGVLISRMTNDVQALDSLVTDSVVTLFTSTLTLLGTIVILLLLDVQLALLTFLIIPVVGIASFIFRVVSADAYRRTGSFWSARINTASAASGRSDLTVVAFGTARLMWRCAISRKVPLPNGRLPVSASKAVTPSA